MREDKKLLIPIEIENCIYTFRGEQVMIDSDLAVMCRVETKVLNQAVKRNIERFPESFRFELTQTELENLKSQIVTSSEHGGRRTSPYVFTEQGAAMLSAVLRSETAIKASLKDLGKKWFAFSKMETDSVTILNEIKELI